MRQKSIILIMLVIVANGCTCSNRRLYLKQPSQSYNSWDNSVPSVSSPSWTDDEIQASTTTTVHLFPL